MAEVNSKAAARMAAGSTGYGKALPSDKGKLSVITICSPDTVTWANGDLLVSGIRLPTGSRFPVGSQVSCDAMGASVVADLGIRDWVTKVAIDADGIAAAVDVAAAGRSPCNNGVFVKAGAEYVTTVASELYVTLSGATPTANKQIRFDVHVVLPG